MLLITNIEQNSLPYCKPINSDTTSANSSISLIRSSMHLKRNKTRSNYRNRTTFLHHHHSFWPTRPPPAWKQRTLVTTVRWRPNRARPRTPAPVIAPQKPSHFREISSANSEHWSELYHQCLFSSQDPSIPVWSSQWQCRALFFYRCWTVPVWWSSF